MVNVALDSKLEREQQWQRKFSIGVYAQNALNSAQSVSTREQASHLPTVKQVIVKSVKEEVSDLCTNNIKSLLQQGQFLKIYK